MTQERTRDTEPLDRIAREFGSGLILVDTRGEVRWMDENTRRCVDGELRKLELPLHRDEQAVDCFVSTVELDIAGEPRRLCVVQAITADEAVRRDVHNLIDTAVRDVLSDASWLARPLAEKLKAWWQVAPPYARTTELALLTAREREILALICEGRSDADMGRILNLSQNTVRNHVASVFRKIGVNRRSAAIIWARERGITRHDVFSAARARSARDNSSHY